MSKVTPFLMFDVQLDAALAFYVDTFPDPEVIRVSRQGGEGPLQSAEFRVGGQRLMGFNGGPYFSFSEGVSLLVDCEDQAEARSCWPIRTR
ncbi:MAG TPA: VOC family protein [Longimicrobiales bacterium]|nr:VOC family protein [Longimicrobiales bacterium]